MIGPKWDEIPWWLKPAAHVFAAIGGVLLWLDRRRK